METPAMPSPKRKKLILSFGGQFIESHIHYKMAAALELYDLLKEVTKKNDAYSKIESEHGTHESFEYFCGSLFERIDKLLLEIDSRS